MFILLFIRNTDWDHSEGIFPVVERGFGLPGKMSDFAKVTKGGVGLSEALLGSFRATPPILILLVYLK